MKAFKRRIKMKTILDIFKALFGMLFVNVIAGLFNFVGKLFK
jgi:hypothetical protein